MPNRDQSGAGLHRREQIPVPNNGFSLSLKFRIVFARTSAAYGAQPEEMRSPPAPAPERPPSPCADVEARRRSHHSRAEGFRFNTPVAADARAEAFASSGRPQEKFLTADDVIAALTPRNAPRLISHVRSTMVPCSTFRASPKPATSKAHCFFSTSAKLRRMPIDVATVGADFLVGAATNGSSARLEPVFSGSKKICSRP